MAPPPNHPLPRAAILLAAGASRRMGADKILAPLAGKPLLLHPLSAFAQTPNLSALILVTSPNRIPLIQPLLHQINYPNIQIVPGGAERPHSVLAGLQALPHLNFLVAVHDAARPLISPSTILATFQLAESLGNASCAEPLTDTLLLASPPTPHSPPTASTSIPRQNLWRMQTPQIFPANLLLPALTHALQSGYLPTDETSTMLNAGYTPFLYHNPLWNPKITYPHDLPLAEAYLQLQNKNH